MGGVGGGEWKGQDGGGEEKGAAGGGGGRGGGAAAGGQAALPGAMHLGRTHQRQLRLQKMDEVAMIDPLRDAGNKKATGPKLKGRLAQMGFEVET